MTIKIDLNTNIIENTNQMKSVRVIKYNFSIPCTMKHTTETSIVTGTLYKVKFKVNGNLETDGSKDCGHCL